MLYSYEDSELTGNFGVWNESSSLGIFRGDEFILGIY